MENQINRSISCEGKSLLHHLKEYQVLNIKPDRRFDELVLFTAMKFNTSVALINFVHQVHTGTKNVCTIAVLKENQSLLKELSNASVLISNPMIAGEMGMKFFAAAPITNDAGYRIGSICIADQKRIIFTGQDKENLERIAEMVRKEINKTNIEITKD